MRKNWCERCSSGLVCRGEKQLQGIVNIRKLTRTWEKLGRDDPFWAVLTEEKYREELCDSDAFYATGLAEMMELAVRMKKLGYPLEGDRAMDFGCGVGRVSQALASYYNQVDGVDISSSMIEHANKHNRVSDKCAYHHNTLPDLALFPDNSFDFIYSRIVLQHMPIALAKRYLKEFFRVLKPGGVMYVQIPDSWDPSSRKFWEYLRKEPSIPILIYKLTRRIVIRVLYSRKKQSMEMHFLPASKVITLIQRLKLSLISVVRDDSCGEAVNSFNYIALKPLIPPIKVRTWTLSKVSKSD